MPTTSATHRTGRSRRRRMLRWYRQAPVAEVVRTLVGVGIVVALVVAAVALLILRTA